MSLQPRNRIEQMLMGAQRASEILLGILLLLLPVALFLFVLDGLVVLVVVGNGGSSAWDVLFPRSFFFLIGCCFWPIGRRLVSGQGRKGGGLLAPRTLAIAESIGGVAATAFGVSRRMAGWPASIKASYEMPPQKRRRKRIKRSRKTA